MQDLYLNIKALKSTSKQSHSRANHPGIKAFWGGWGVNHKILHGNDVTHINNNYEATCAHPRKLRNVPRVPLGQAFTH